MPVEVQELEVQAQAVDASERPAPAAAAPPGPTEAQIADTAERAWRRVAGLQERVRAD